MKKLPDAFKHPETLSLAYFEASLLVEHLSDIAGDQGAVLGFGSGQRFEMDLGPIGKFNVTSLIGLINIIKTTNMGHILSTPSVMALDNEESLIEVGAKVPVSVNSSTGQGGVTTSNVERQNVTTKLTITPYISPDTDTVQMKLDQEVADIQDVNIKAADLAKVLFAQPEERGAIELGVAAHVIIGVGMERLAVLVLPHFFRVVLGFDVHRPGAPVVLLPTDVVAAFEQQDPFA